MGRHSVLRSALRLRLVAGLFVFALVLGLAPFSSVSAEPEKPTKVFFDKTGQVLGEPFLDAWQDQGGVGEAGEPISPAIQQGNSWVQWFTYARLEISKPSLEQATASDAVDAKIGLSVAQDLGLMALHPAFTTHHDAAGPNSRLFGNGHLLANAFLKTWEDGDTGKRLGDPISEEFTVGDTTYQFFERGALSWNPNFGVNMVPLGVYDAALHSALRLSGTKPDGVPSYSEHVLNPPGLGGSKWIDINLSNYTLSAMEGDSAVFQAPIVDGAAATPTVTGTFSVYWKLDTQTMEGPNADGSNYRTEDVPWVMYFYQDWAIHGAYWRSSFGFSGSHGCVNLPVSDAAWLYSWTPYGTTVVVHY
jgi:hypothetical protein